MYTLETKKKKTSDQSCLHSILECIKHRVNIHRTILSYLMMNVHTLDTKKDCSDLSSRFEVYMKKRLFCLRRQDYYIIFFRRSK